MIAFENVTFAYPRKSPVITDFSCVFPTTGVVNLRGESGKGKTTVLRLLAGLEKPQKGTVTAPESVAVMFQENRLLPWLTVAENITVATGVDRATALLWLERLELTPYADTVPALLSGGEQRRVALARALATEAPLLLLDEPFTGMDEAIRNKSAVWIKERAQTTAVVLVTHVPEEAELLEASAIDF